MGKCRNPTDLTGQTRLNQGAASGWVEVVSVADAQSWCSASSPACLERPLCYEAAHLTADVQTDGPRIWLWCRTPLHVCQEKDALNPKFFYFEQLHRNYQVQLAKSKTLMINDGRENTNYFCLPWISRLWFSGSQFLTASLINLVYHSISKFTHQLWNVSNWKKKWLTSKSETFGYWQRKCKSD